MPKTSFGGIVSAINRVVAKLEGFAVALDYATVTHAATSKTTPVDADEIGLWDSVTGLIRKLTWANLKATLKTYFDTMYHIGGSKCLTANATTSSVTAVATNLAFAIGINEVYDIDIYGSASKATSAEGLKLAIGAPAGCVVVGIAEQGGATLAAPLVPSLISAINTLGTAFATGIGIRVGFRAHIRVVNAGTAGNITLQFATVTANVATIYAGSKMQWRKSTQV